MLRRSYKETQGVWITHIRTSRIFNCVPILLPGDINVIEAARYIDAIFATLITKKLDKTLIFDSYYMFLYALLALFGRSYHHRESLREDVFKFSNSYLPGCTQEEREDADQLLDKFRNWKGLHIHGHN